MNVERWQQQNKPVVEDSGTTKLLRATVYKFDKNGKLIEVKRSA